MAGRKRKEEIRKAYATAQKDLGGTRIAEAIGIDVKRLYVFASQGHLGDDDAAKVEAFLIREGYLQNNIAQGVIARPAEIEDPEQQTVAQLSNLILMLGAHEVPLSPKIPLLRSGIEYVLDGLIPLLEKKAAAQKPSATQPPADPSDAV